jgi:hypothetical protein
MGRGLVPEDGFMTSQTVLPPNSVRSAYEDFLEAFRTAIEGANLNLSYPERPLKSSFVEAGGNDRAAFIWSFYLKDWPCKRLGKNQRLDVVVKAMETFIRPSWVLSKSTVYVNYFVVSDSAAKLVQSLHYDFVEGGQHDHPFFHVQLTDELIPQEDLQNAGFDLSVAASGNECWVTTRIPTPDMTLASVIYCLMADHLGSSGFSEFAENVESIQNRIPAPSFEPIKKSLDASAAHFKSSHWFSHMDGL